MTQSPPTLGYSNLPSDAQVIKREADGSVTYAVRQGSIIPAVAFAAFALTALTLGFTLSVIHAIEAERGRYMAMPLGVAASCVLLALAVVVGTRMAWQRRHHERAVRIVGDRLDILTPESVMEESGFPTSAIERFDVVARGLDVRMRPIGDLEIHFHDGRQRIALRAIHVAELRMISNELNQKLPNH